MFWTLLGLAKGGSHLEVLPVMQAGKAAQERLQAAERLVQQLQQEVQDSQTEAAEQHAALQVAAAEQQHALEVAAAERHPAAEAQQARLEKRLGCCQRRLERRTQQLATALAAAAADGPQQQPAEASSKGQQARVLSDVLTPDPADAPATEPGLAG